MRLGTLGLNLCNPAIGGAFDPETSLTGLIARYAASDPSQTATPLDVDFTTSEVDTTNDRITVANQGFDPLTSGVSQFGYAVPVTYSTSGSPIGGLTNGATYYLRWDGTGYKVYPEAIDGDYDTIPGQHEIEDTWPAQNMIQQVNAINLTSTGSGTHNFTSLPLAASVREFYGNEPYNLESASVSAKQTHMQIATDGYGYKYYKNRITSREFRSSTYNHHGARWTQGNSNADYNQARAAIGGNRTVAMTFVCTPKITQHYSYPKSYITNSDVSGSTFTNKNYAGTATAHPFTTGWIVRLQESTGPVPSNMDTVTQYYVRDLTANTFSLHPTLADANAGTNAITPTIGGTEKFLVYASQRVGDSVRMQFLGDIYGPDNDSATNTLAPRQWFAGPVSSGIASDMSNSNTVTVSGANNGEWFITGTTGNFPNGAKINLWLPMDSVGPTRTDTGVALVAGTFWISRSPTNTARIRLHTSEANALANVGVASNSGSFTGIKYSLAGAGQAIFQWDDSKVGFSTNVYNDSASPTYFDSRQPADTPVAVTWLADFNDPAETYAVVRVYVNGVLAETKEYTARAKANLPASDNDNVTAWLMFGDTVTHVPGNLDIYEMVIQASTGAISGTEIANFHNWYINTEYPNLFNPPLDDALLLETGDTLLLESGDRLLLE